MSGNQEKYRPPMKNARFLRLTAEIGHFSLVVSVFDSFKQFYAV